MLRKFAILVLVMFLAACSSKSRYITIVDDPGGNVDEYAAFWKRVASSGQLVRIDGMCASSCTLVMSFVPLDRICVTRNAAMGFHLATIEGRPAPMLTRRLVRTYPETVQRWIQAHGGVESLVVEDLLILRGDELARILQPCDRYQFAAK